MSYQFLCEFFAAKIEDLYKDFEDPAPFRIQQVLDEIELIPDQRARDVCFVTVRTALKGPLVELCHASKKRADKKYGVRVGPGDEIFEIATALIAAIRRDSFSETA